MSFLDVNADSLRAASLNSYYDPGRRPEPGVFSNFLPGAGSYFMRGMAESGRALSMAGAAVPVLADKLIGSDNRGESFGDRYFRWHDETFNRAVDYWTPKPGEVGAAGQVVGSLAAGLTQFLANPALLIGTSQLSTAEDLVRQGVDAGAANVAGDVAGLSTVAGIALPIFGKTLAGKIATGAAGNLATNIPQAAITRAVVQASGAPKGVAEQFDPFDVRARLVDLLMGIAFGAKSHLDAHLEAKQKAFIEGGIPSKPTAIADAAAKAFESPLTATQRDAVMVMNAARHLDEAALPWKAGEAEHTAAVDNVRTAIAQISRGQEVDVPPLPAEDFLTVWHGSPHKFDAFDSSKIGTGEGAQAYGHGLYLAESPKVAQWYAESLAGKQYSPSDLVSANGMTLKELMKDAPPLARAKVTSYVNNAQGDMAKASADFDAFVQQQHRDNGALTDAGKAVLAEAQGWMRKLADAKISFAPKPTGNLYKVALPDSVIAKMLDWDKPLSQQAPEVQKAVTDAMLKRGITKSVADYIVANKTGNEALATISRGAYDARLNVPDGPQAAAASQMLQSAGIPGIRYLDGGSRATGEGTYNYVIFPGEESKLRIHERNGEAVQLAQAIADAAPKSAEPVAAPEMRVHDVEKAMKTAQALSATIDAASADPATRVRLLKSEAQRLRSTADTAPTPDIAAHAKMAADMLENRAVFADDLRVPSGEFDPATGAPKTISANESIAKATAEAEHVKATAEGLMRTVATCILGGI